MRLEVCVDTSEGLATAVAGGADRIELCAALALGGLTSSAGLMGLAAASPVPVMVMIRPRAGDFQWSETEVAMMEAEIAAARAAGLAGVVLGASLPDGRLDGGVLERLVVAAAGMDLTLHRCFDLVPDKGEALELAIRLGFRRVLTSGGAITVDKGMAQIAALVTQAAGRVTIMPGSGVGPDQVAALKALGIAEIHGSCSVPMTVAKGLVDMGFSPAGLRRTDAGKLRALRRAME
jgi:copper homeostasis protein